MADDKPQEGPKGSAKLQAPRFSLQLTATENEDEQTIDLAKMQAGNRERLAKLLKKGDTLKQLGLVDERPAAVAAAPAVPAGEIEILLARKAASVCGLLAVLAVQRAGYRPDQAAMMAFTAEDEAQIAPAVLAVLNKYQILGGKYAEEIALVSAVGITVYNKYQLMLAAQQQPLPLTPAA